MISKNDFPLDQKKEPMPLDNGLCYTVEFQFYLFVA